MKLSSIWFMLYDYRKGSTITESSLEFSSGPLTNATEVKSIFLTAISSDPGFTVNPSSVSVALTMGQYTVTPSLKPPCISDLY